MHAPSAPRGPLRVGLRLQLSLALGLLAIVCLAAVAVGLVTLLSLHNQTQTAVMVGEARRAAAERVALATLLCRRYEKDFFLTLDQPAVRADYFRQWQGAHSDLQAAIDQYAAHAQTEAEQQQVLDWQTTAQAYFAAITGVERAIVTGELRTPQAANDALTPFKDRIRLLTESAVAVADQERGRLHAINTALLETTRSAAQLLVGLSAGVLLFALFWSLWFPQRLLRPIRELRDATRRFAQGDVSARAPIGRSDEFGDLGASFNQMVEQIRSQMTELDQRAVVEEQNRKLQSLLDLVRVLETPAIPLLDGVLLVPVVGNLDTQRAATLQQHILASVFHQRAHTVLLDLTGVAVVDTQVAQAIQRLIQGVQLLGTEITLTGISPQVAQTLSELGIGFERVRIARSVQEGIGAILT